MRKSLSAVLIGVGVFAIVLAGMFRFYAPSAAEKTPLNTNATVVSVGPGTISNPSTGESTQVQVKATRILRADSSASNSDVVVFDESVCFVKVIGNTPNCVDAHDPQGRLLGLTTDRRAENRHTAMAVNNAKYNEAVNGTSVKHAGLGYKFPFNTKKKSYPWYDADTLTAPLAIYKSTTKVAGLKVYEFVSTVPATKAEISPGLVGMISDVRTVWVEPTTGVIVKGSEQQTRTLTTGEKVLDFNVTFDNAGVKSQAKLAKDGKNKITLVTVILPIVALIIGILALVGAFLYMRRGSGDTRGEAGRHGAPGPDDEPNYGADPNQPGTDPAYGETAPYAGNPQT